MLVLLLTLGGQYLKGDLNLSFLFSGQNLKMSFMSYFLFLMVMVWTSALQKIVDVIGDSNSNSGEKKNGTCTWLWAKCGIECRPGSKNNFACLLGFLRKKYVHKKC